MNQEKELLEKARDFYDSISENKTISKAMADFARQEVHKALEEAAEMVGNYFEDDDSPKTGETEAYIEGLKDASDIINKLKEKY